MEECKNSLRSAAVDVGSNCTSATNRDEYREIARLHESGNVIWEGNVLGKTAVRKFDSSVAIREGKRWG